MGMAQTGGGTRPGEPAAQAGGAAPQAVTRDLQSAALKHAILASDNIVLSANAVPQDSARTLEAGFFNYPTKPIKMDQFLASLDLGLEYSRTGTAPSTRQESA